MLGDRSRREVRAQRLLHRGMAEHAALARAGHRDAHAARRLRHVTRRRSRSATPDCGTSRSAAFSGTGNSTAVMISPCSKRGREHALEEVIRLDRAPVRLDRRAERQHRGRIVGGRIVVGEAAADRAAMAHRLVADMRRQAPPAPGSSPSPRRCRPPSPCVVMPPIVTVLPDTVMPASPSFARSTTTSACSAAASAPGSRSCRRRAPSPRHRHPAPSPHRRGSRLLICEIIHRAVPSFPIIPRPSGAHRPG